jgi:hypothetical protein
MEGISRDLKNTATKLDPAMPKNCSEQFVTIERIKELLPRKTSAGVTQAVVDEINRIEETTGLPQDYMEEKILSNLHRLSGSGYTLEKLVNAIKYAQLCEHYNKEQSWSIVFPDRYKRLKDAGKKVSNHVSMYEQTDLVIEMKTAMIIPDSLTYRPVAHKMTMKLVELANGQAAGGKDVSANVQFLAASKLVELYKMPEVKEAQLTIGMDAESKSVTQNLADQIAKMTVIQAKRLDAGEDIGSVQKLNLGEQIIDIEVN